MKAVSGMLAIAVALVLVGCGGNGGPAGGSGLIEANETVISAETSGRVIERRFDEGDQVVAGDTLAVIDPSRVELELASAYAGRDVLESQLAAAQLQVKQAVARQDFASTEFERVDRLLQSGTATKRQYDQAQLDFTQADLARRTAEAQVKTYKTQLVKTDADIASLQRQLRDCYPLAPSAGIVTEKYIDPGELAAPGKPLVKTARLDTVWVKVYLPAGKFANVRLGTGASVSTESGGREYRGTIIWTSPESEFTPKNVQTEQSRADLVYAVKVRLPNDDGSLKIGMPVFVTLEE